MSETMTTVPVPAAMPGEESTHSPFNACCYRQQCKALEARALAAEAALAGEREALDPFAKAGEQWKGWHPDTRLMCQGADAGLTIGDLYRAASIRAQGE